jgi:hypothetical protein
MLSKYVRILLFDYQSAVYRPNFLYHPIFLNSDLLNCKYITVLKSLSLNLLDCNNETDLFTQCVSLYIIMGQITYLFIYIYMCMCKQMNIELSKYFSLYIYTDLLIVYIHVLYKQIYMYTFICVCIHLQFYGSQQSNI